MDHLNQTLKELDQEDIIWIISSFTALFAIYSNYFERNYYLFKDFDAKKKYKTINLIIGSISFLIYLYFLLLSYHKFRQAHYQSSFHTYRIQQANFIAASLVVLASIIYLIIEIFGDEDTDTNLLI